MKKNTTYEQAMSRLDEIVTALNQGTVPLEDSLKLFSEGAELISFCNKKLEDAQLTVEKLFPQTGEEDDG